MFNNTISLTRDEKKTDSYGRILSNKCKRITIVSLSCTSMQRVNTKGHILFQDKGFEGKQLIYRWDSKSLDFTIISKIALTDYIEYTDQLGKRHEYKLIDFETRTILGCTWITLYGENISARDVREVPHLMQNSKSI